MCYLTDHKGSIDTQLVTKSSITVRLGRSKSNIIIQERVLFEPTITIEGKDLSFMPILISVEAAEALFSRIISMNPSILLSCVLCSDTFCFNQSREKHYNTQIR